MISFKDWRHPNVDVVKHFANAFDINYHRDEDILQRVFKDSIANPTVIEKRVGFLNSYYQTGLNRKNADQSKYVVSFLKKHSVGLEAKIRNGDVQAVSDIARHDSENENCFVFATKYCSFSNTEAFPIYDGQVVKALNWFQYKSGDRFYKGKYLRLDKLREGCEYGKYRGIVNVFIEHYRIAVTTWTVDEIKKGELSYKDLDKFLWVAGKNLPKVGNNL